MSGEELRAWREYRRLTQADLARMLDVRQNTIWRWESGSVPVDRRTTLAIKGLEQEEHEQQAALAVPA